MSSYTRVRPADDDVIGQRFLRLFLYLSPRQHVLSHVTLRSVSRAQRRKQRRRGKKNYESANDRKEKRADRNDGAAAVAKKEDSDEKNRRSVSQNRARVCSDGHETTHRIGGLSHGNDRASMIWKRIVRASMLAA